MAENKQGYWFPAKKYGWGWGFPCKWQGWVVFFLYLAVITGTSFVIPPHENILGYFALIFSSSLVLIGICWKKGERPKWQWGKK